MRQLSSTVHAVMEVCAYCFLHNILLAIDMAKPGIILSKILAIMHKQLSYSISAWGDEVQVHSIVVHPLNCRPVN